MTNIQNIPSKFRSQYPSLVLFLLVGFYGIGCVPSDYIYNSNPAITTIPNSGDVVINPYGGGCGTNCTHEHTYYDPYYRNYYDPYRNGVYYRDGNYYDDIHYRDRKYRRLKKAKPAQHKKAPQYAPARKFEPARGVVKPPAIKKTRKLNPSVRKTGRLKRGKTTTPRRSTTRKLKPAKKSKPDR